MSFREIAIGLTNSDISAIRYKYDAGDYPGAYQEVAKALRRSGAGDRAPASRPHAANSNIVWRFFKAAARQRIHRSKAGLLSMALAACGSSGVTQPFTELDECAPFVHAGERPLPLLEKSFRLREIFLPPDGRPSDLVTASGPGFGEFYVAGRLGRTYSAVNDRPNLIIEYGAPAQCGKNSLVARNNGLEGCRTDGCRLVGTYSGRRIVSAKLMLPAYNGNSDDLTLRQGACKVYATAALSGLGAAWTDGRLSDVELGPGHDPFGRTYRYQLKGDSNLIKCISKTGDVK